METIKHEKWEIILGAITVFVIIGAIFAGQYWNEKRIVKEMEIFDTKPIGSEIIHGNRDKKQVIFTFDGGSGNNSAEKILETLKKHNVKGTFFLTGQFVVTYPDLVKQIVADGHEIFNHTYSHPRLTEVGAASIRNEFKRMDMALWAVAGISSKPYMRPPYGDRDTRVMEVAKEEGYRTVMWSLDALDWEESLGRTASEVKALILSNVRNGEIYLMHLGDNITGAILDDVFNNIENMGYKIVSLTQGL